MFLNMKLNSKNHETRAKAIAKVRNQDKLLPLLLKENQYDVLEAGMKNLVPNSAVSSLALNGDLSEAVRKTAIREWISRKKEELEHYCEAPESYRTTLNGMRNFCFDIALSAPNRSFFLEALTGIVEQRDLVDLLIALGKKKEECSGLPLLEKQRIYVVSSYDLLCKDVWERLTDPKQIARAFTSPDIPFLPVGKIEDIRDKDLLVQVAENGATESVRSHAETTLSKFDGNAAADRFKKQIETESDAGALLDRLMKEDDVRQMDAIADRLAEVGDSTYNNKLKRLIAEVSANRDEYDPNLRIRLTNTYGKWNHMDWKKAMLTFADETDLKKYQHDLVNPDNIMGQIFALKDLQELYRMGRFKREIAAMTFKGQPVPTYKDPNAGGFIV